MRANDHRPLEVNTISARSGHAGDVHPVDHRAGCGQPCATRQVVSTPDAPSSPLYSQALKAGGYVHVLGLVRIEVPPEPSLA
jgi:hypothetical protein